MPAKPKPMSKQSKIGTFEQKALHKWLISFNLHLSLAAEQTELSDTVAVCNYTVLAAITHK